MPHPPRGALIDLTRHRQRNASISDVAHEAHIWQIPLGVESLLARASLDDASCLDAAERRRAQRFDDGVARHRFVFAHAAMRTILARYCDCAPSELRFAQNQGKPRLEECGTLEFNLSRSGEIALLAVSSGVSVGVDIEEIRPIDAPRLATRHFSSAEFARLHRHAAGSAAHLREFFATWTRKEALLKLEGSGLIDQLDLVDTRMRGVPRRSGSVRVRSIEAPRGYVAALASRHRISVKYFHAASIE